ncbi:MAG: peptide chain release factor 3 [Hyphomicrobium sp.]
MTASAEHTKETWRRRTFAIISHPDAGKTTLTEKLLLFGGAIQLAGHVKARGERRSTRSDWMAIEQARGISVTSSVMTFEYEGNVFNLLDTPGHSDFSEDTYRTLSAVDAAVMVIDAAKGIESQTRKLFEVCRLRDIPIVTFINKIDREGVDPLALIDEISSSLALDLTPMTWPLGMGSGFQGCLDLHGKRVLLPERDRTTPYGRVVQLDALEDVTALEGLGQLPDVERSVEEMQLALGALPTFDRVAFHEGHLSPVFFGSALRNFCVEELLKALGQSAPGPLARKATHRTIDPNEEAVTGFVFKVQANMNPQHRDRIAFMRLCSGKFRRGMKLFHPRTQKQIAVTAPILFFAQQRQTADEAYPGDIIGIPNHGTIRVGDTFTEGEMMTFEGIPNFAPEILRRVAIEDGMMAKRLNKALADLAEEGVVQVFQPLLGSRTILGVVGELQFEVLASRLNQEYGVTIQYETTPYTMARWIVAEDKDKLEQFISRQRSQVSRDRDGHYVFMAESAFWLNHAEENAPGVKFSATQERG